MCFLLFPPLLGTRLQRRDPYVPHTSFSWVHWTPGWDRTSPGERAEFEAPWRGRMDWSLMGSGPGVRIAAQYWL